MGQSGRDRVRCSSLRNYAEFEEITQAFIVRIWKERRETSVVPPIWRGVIEYVPTGEKRCLKDRHGIPGFVGPLNCAP